MYSPGGSDITPLLASYEGISTGALNLTLVRRLFWAATLCVIARHTRMAAAIRMIFISFAPLFETAGSRYEFTRLGAGRRTRPYPRAATHCSEIVVCPGLLRYAVTASRSQPERHRSVPQCSLSSVSCRLTWRAGASGPDVTEYPARPVRRNRRRPVLWRTCGHPRLAGACVRPTVAGHGTAVYRDVAHHRDRERYAGAGPPPRRPRRHGAAAVVGDWSDAGRGQPTRAATGKGRRLLRDRHHRRRHRSDRLARPVHPVEPFPIIGEQCRARSGRVLDPAGCGAAGARGEIADRRTSSSGQRDAGPRGTAAHPTHADRHFRHCRGRGGHAAHRAVRAIAGLLPDLGRTLVDSHALDPAGAGRPGDGRAVPTNPLSDVAVAGDRVHHLEPVHRAARDSGARQGTPRRESSSRSRCRRKCGRPRADLVHVSQCGEATEPLLRTVCRLVCRCASPVLTTAHACRCGYPQRVWQPEHRDTVPAQPDASARGPVPPV